MNFDAYTLARGWLSAALASSHERDDGLLYRTVHVELHASGVRLVATDRYLLLSAWVPDVDNLYEPEPALDDEPVTRITARDQWHRANGLFGHLLSLTGGGDDPEKVDVRMNLETSKGKQGQLDGIGSARRLTIDHPDHERVILDPHDAPWPDWRGLLYSHVQRKTDVIALDPDRLGALAKLGRYHPHAPILWRFGGADKLARLEVGSSEPHVFGIVMPVAWRWELPDDEPTETEEP